MSSKKGRFTWQSSSQTHVGVVREINEDSFLAAEDIGLWAIADGMGGHEAGDIASKIVIDSLRGISFSSNRITLLRNLRQCLMGANEKILKLSAQLTQRGVMGTTIVVFLCYEDKGICLWVGDSRMYLCRMGQFRALTHDHSQTEERIKLGLLSRENVGKKPISHVLTRAVGVEADLQIDVITGDLQDGDVFLLCSDGLNNAVSHQEIENVLMSETCQKSAKTLIERAVSKGAPDNVTAIVIHIHQLANSS